MSLNPFKPFDMVACARIIAPVMKVKAKDVVGVSQTNDVVAARAVVIRVAIEQGVSLSAIGRRLGRHHTTIMHASRNMDRYMQYDGALEAYERLVAWRECAR